MSNPLQGAADGRRLAVSSTGSSTADAVDPRFGRCAYFVISDESSGRTEIVANTARALGNGAGIQAAQDLLNRGVTIVVTGDVGPNAYRTLSAAGIRVFRCTGTSVADAIRDFKLGKLVEVSRPTSPGHHGHGAGGRRGWP
ncbi:MAG TPA: NifB/NifX family molybdenum-iron cluster-binding protein [Thermoplasmata archaeon]